MAFASIFVLFVITLRHAKFGAFGLTDMHIKVPEAVRTGSSVTLSCDYDLESAALYTIKWYRDDVEFYRYVPKESPPFQMFPLSHLNVDFYKSNWKEVTLTNVKRETAGEYKCEVTADAPLFHTDIRFASLLVADVPEDEAVLKAEVLKVAPLERIKANCTTPASYPSMNITWLINEKEVRSQNHILIHNFVSRYEALPGLESAQSAISIRATPELFRGGKMRLRCLATMFTLYASSKEVQIQEDAPQLALIMGPTPPLHSSAGGRTNAFEAIAMLGLNIFQILSNIKATIS